MTYSIIKKAQLEGAHRLDAEYFQPLYLELEQKLKEAHLVTIKNLGLSVDASAFYPSIAEYYNSVGDIPFVRVADVFSTRLIEDGLLFLPKIIVNQFKTIRIGKPGDIIITKGGTVGNAALLPNTYPEYALSRDIIYIKSSRLSEEQRISLLLFLNSRLGMLQLIRGASQQVQAHLTFPIIRELLVPKVPIKDAVSLYNESFKAETASILFYKRAEDLLLGELGLKDFQVEDDLSFVINLSGVKSANRIDVDYFQPKYQRLINRFRNKAERLGVIAKRINSAVKIQMETNYNYIEISDINVGSGEIMFNVIQGKDLPANAKIKITGGEIIISKVRPTRGAVSIIPDEWKNNYVASGAFSIFKVESPRKEYLQVVLRSIIGKMQLEKPTTGTSYPTITDQDVENILIPILSIEIQQKIADLVRKSHEARKKSKELLEEAKRKVEEMIERGESGKN